MSLNAPGIHARLAACIAVTSGKGGVGKTTLTINLAVALARLGHRVGVLDADFALGNIDVMLGLTPAAHLGAVLSGDLEVEDIVLDGPSGVMVIPAGSGVRALTALDGEQWTRLADVIESLKQSLDFLIVDTASGIADNVIDLIGLSDYALVVTSYEPAAVVDAYAVVKLVSAADATRPIGIVVNATRDPEEGERVYRQLALAAERFLGRSLRYDGFVLSDPELRDAAMDQSPLVGRDSTGPASRCFRRLAQRFAAWRPSGGSPWPAPRVSPEIATVIEQPRDGNRAGVSGEAPRCA